MRIVSVFLLKRNNRQLSKQSGHLVHTHIIIFLKRKVKDNHNATLPYVFIIWDFANSYLTHTLGAQLKEGVDKGMG